MKRLGVLSDTHIPVRSPILPPKLFSLFKGVDYILHAGDVEVQKVLDELEGIAPVLAVAGNMDSALNSLPLKRQMEIDGIRIGLIHGYGGPRNQIRERIRKQFNKPDVIIYGHTHLPFWGEEAGIWYMNPGSPTDSLFAPYPSVGILEIEYGKINGEIISL
ncbi:metallophosphatase family protein [bacterium]|nr:metallophosphatase family protein [bacterium]